MTTICLVRHGETDWNKHKRLQGQEDIPLNELGIEQAKECGEHLKTEQWDMIISSPLSRAKKTAEIIQTYMETPLDIIEMDAFKERSFGKGSGLYFHEIQSLYPDRNYPGMESWEAFKTRIFQGLHQVHQEYPNQKILLVAHGAVINGILSVLSNGEIGSGKTKLINACITNIERLEDSWKVTNYNETSHLSSFTQH
ncbi:histidine phosphatase family protein [Pontibacillus yanchengensis]|uniref:Phosphatase n=1 Tax=Pontibacillus yanchengensis Y32 TaxID=1385514 RepID=A0A0A2TC20_9BACI|nr:histidine phosphatase family protein [Pontibacillus yanchengensis]KGP73337.1 phosphatase [Pontibacillus yanchengensis Y32]